MTCITIKNKDKLLDKLAKDGKSELLSVFDKVGVMTSLQQPISLNLKLSETKSLKNILIADSYEDLNLSNNEAVEFGANLQKVALLNSNPIVLNANGNLEYDNNFKDVRSRVSDLINREFIATDVAIENSPDYLITKPVRDQEARKVKLNVNSLIALEAERNKLIKNNASESKIDSIRSKIHMLQKQNNESSKYVKWFQEYPTMEALSVKSTADIEESIRLVSKSVVTWEDLTRLKDMTNLWLAISDNNSNILKLGHEYEIPGVQEELNNIERHFRFIQSKINDINKKKTLETANLELDEDVTIEDLTKYASDDSWMTSHMRGLRRSRIPILRLIAKLVTKANDAALASFKTIENRIDSAYDKIRGEIGNDFTEFIAHNKNGNPVGTLVDRFTFEFWKKLGASRRANAKSQRKWLQDNTIVLNFSWLFDDKSIIVDSKYLTKKGSAKSEEDFKKYLISQLGQDGYNEYYEQAQNIYSEYLKSRDTYYQYLLHGEDSLGTEEDLDFREWDEMNSPFLQGHHAMTFKEKGVSTPYRKVNSDIVVRVAKRTDNNGKDLGFYDEAFANIESHEGKYEFYKAMKDVISDSRVNFGYEYGLHANSLPYLESALASQLTHEGSNMLKSSKKLADASLQFFGAKDKNSDHIEIDKDGNVINRHINKNVVTIDQVANDLFKYKVLEFTQDEGRSPDKAETQEMLESSYAEAGQNQDLDLVKLMKLLAMNSTAYKHKTMVKDEVELITALFTENAADRDKNVLLTNAIKFLENTLDADYYGVVTSENSINLSGAAKYKGILPAKNKKKAQILENEIDRINESDISDKKKEEEVNKILTQLEHLHVKVYATSLLRKFLAYSRILGIGWNVISSTTNFLFGQIGNFQRAIQGDHFGINDMREAISLTVGFDRNKIENISKKTGLVGDITYEFLKPAERQGNTGRFQNLKNKTDPYFLQTMSEGLNQKPIMVAMLRNTLVEDIDGNQSNLYDIMDNEGEVDRGWYGIDDTEVGLSGNELLSEAMYKVRGVVQETHGDYNSTLMGNNKATIQAMIMFKRWIFEMGFRRWGKGGIYQEGTKTLLKIASGKKSDVTPKQMGMLRALYAEVGFAVLIMAASALLGKFLPDEDDFEDPSIGLQFVINLLKRLEDETTFFYNPMSFINIIENPVSGSRTVIDMIRAGLSTAGFWRNDPQKDYYRSGKYKGQFKPPVLYGKVTPLYGQYQRTTHYGKEPIYTKEWYNPWKEE